MGDAALHEFRPILIRRNQNGGKTVMLVGLPLLQVLDRMGCGGLVLATDGQVLAINDGARSILQKTFSLTEGDLDELHGSGREYVKHLLNRGRTRIQLDSENWILIEREDEPPLIMNAVPVPVLNEGGAHTVLILIDLATHPKPNRAALERIYRLTPAEAKLAVRLGQGSALAEAAEALGISVATARTQLKAIFDKTHTHRQAELVILIARLSALP
jgi:DNA-binding CsgD family transcriptional regulator